MPASAPTSQRAPAATPLVALPGLARSLGVGALLVKDETARFGLPAFKSLGVEFAVHQLAARGGLAGVTTLVCASAGNHGRAVARAARSAGLAATIFLDDAVAASRVAAIASEGAEVVRVRRQLRRRRAGRRRRMPPPPAAWSCRIPRGTATRRSRATSCWATPG